ncbi:MAG: metal-dependent hydrolase [Thiotrichales bacterium]|nr:metal-dependent hydrolase [Thiotrichales bacterium]
MNWCKTLLATAALSFSGLTLAATELTFYGQSGYKIVTEQGHVILIDPWIKNPKNSKGEAQLKALEKVDLILLTHGHFDHLGETVQIAEKTGARLVTNYDLGNVLVEKLGFPKAQFGFSSTGNLGGQISLLNGDVKVGFTPALHSSSVGVPMTDGTETTYGGTQTGFHIQLKNGPSFYHTGDTDAFSDMKLVNLFGPVDVMLTAIGDTFTMGPKRAAYAVKMVEPRKMVIPNHYGTFELLSGTPDAFAEALKAQGIKTPMKALQPGETITFE